MMRFEFATSGRIVFGPGTRKEAAPAAREWGRRGIVVSGRSLERTGELREDLTRQGAETQIFQAAGEPKIADLIEGVRLAREFEAQWVIGIGGGSALDLAKAIAAMLANPGEVMDYLEVIGRGRALSQPSAPCMAIPTTAGTGSEATRNAVLASPEHRVKVSMRSAWMLPRLAIVDPELTYSAPPALTASTGLDAFSQLLEAFVSIKSNAFTDILCVEGLGKAAGAILRAASGDGRDAPAREDMALASLLSGMALANAGLGAIHGFAGPLGGMFDAPHGALCARLLPFVWEANLRALQTRAPNSPALAKYEKAARLAASGPQALPGDGPQWAFGLIEKLRIPPLSAYGMTLADIPAAAEKARQAGSMKGNPIVLTDEELREILRAAL